MDSLHRVQSFRLLSMSSLQASKPVRAPLGLQLPLWHNHFLQPGTARAAVCSISAPPVHSMGCRGLTCITTFCSLGCRGISALAPLNTYSLPWPWCLRGCFNCFFSHVSVLFFTAAVQHLLLFLKYIYTETPQAWLLWSALASGGSIAEQAGTDSEQHRDSQGLLSQRTPLNSPSAHPPVHQNAICPVYILDSF